MYTAADYARKNGMTEKSVIESIERGLLRGILQDGTWYLDLPEGSRSHSQKISNRTTHRNMAQTGFIIFIILSNLSGFGAAIGAAAVAQSNVDKYTSLAAYSASQQIPIIVVAILATGLVSCLFFVGLATIAKGIVQLDESRQLTPVKVDT